ncbi:MAG: hypothetical protein LLG43_09960 [Deltaproteobacteria bacterium]|nr:hypothetical protein [Deltaproteobacteria bacterium]
MNKDVQSNDRQPMQMGCLALLVRITWMIFGNLVLILTAFSIALRKAGMVLDIVFWTAAAGLILVRYLDITVFGGFTKDFEPATLKDWRLYSLMLLAASGVLWLLAHGAALVL